MSGLPCIKCRGTGAADWEDSCDACSGSGDQKCEQRGCDEDAVGFNDDGKALCADCLMEWAQEEFEP